MVFTLLLNTLDDDHQNFVLDLYNKYNKMIRRIALDYMHNSHDADDIVNSVMVKVIKHVDVFEGRTGDELTSLIVTYSKTTANDFFRKKKRIMEQEYQTRVVNDDGEEISDDIIDQNMDVENIVITNETIEIAKKALLKLSETDQEIIKLRLIQGHSSKEAADVVKISVNAVDLRYKKARERLLRLIGDKLI